MAKQQVMPAKNHKEATAAMIDSHPWCDIRITSNTNRMEVTTNGKESQNRIKQSRNDEPNHDKVKQAGNRGRGKKRKRKKEKIKKGVFTSFRKGKKIRKTAMAHHGYVF